MTLTLSPKKVSLSLLEEIWRQDKNVKIDLSFKDKVNKSANIVKKAISGSKPVYGINTGFGKLSSVMVSHEETEALQRNLILSHCCGVGDYLDISTTRLMMVLKLLSLGRGASGVRWTTLEHIETMLANNIIPIIPDQGSVGASGDLAPLAHMSAAMIGEGEVFYLGSRVPSSKALKDCGLQPLILAAKEGLALINGTQFSTACALAGLFDAFRNAFSGVVSSALSTDAIMGSTDPLTSDIHELRGHLGQITVAKAMRNIMEGSEIRESHREGDARVQDPYCIRCQPQVTGAALDILKMAGKTLEIEANAVTDNPLIISETGKIISGGNFHAEPVAFVSDQIALAIAEIGAISQRRIALMVDPALSFDLPPFLTPNPGLNSGLMIAEVTSAALMSENKHLANPCSTDSTPTSANQEDHVSMAAHAARRLKKMNKNLNTIIGIELMCGAQGVEFRAPLKTSVKLTKVLSSIRAVVPKIVEDRYMANDIEILRKLVESGKILEVSDLNSYID